ncbi:hypothetical protein DFP72DRAFT_1080537 [Ephemerocybe angulata]|uniref:Peptidase C14 caspase domain-containing protein n=1 Tax=Ephemerocybe angulata TaxID=980116 RepID=A0A8H6HB47_9AGAR|nr:hypothetical protein DFP72DRAFT_1080537 [Tulosesus angulatus]
MAKLSGAVPDADSINDYLQSELKVPSSQIRNLRDKQATRAGIIAAFEWLRDLNPPDFKPQDPILIYYAGHGGEVPTKGKQGNNLTVILDCCHSGSGARGDEDETTTVRGGELHPNDAPEGLDSHIVTGYKPPQPTGGTRGIKVAKGFANQDMNSHGQPAAPTNSPMIGLGDDSPVPFKFVENKAEAKLGIVAEGNKQVAFNVLETRATDYGFTRMPTTFIIKEGVKIEFYALEDKEDEYGEDNREPVGPDLYRDGRVEIDVDDETRYGMKITNSTPFNLHFACFFFDHADLSTTALNEMVAKTAHRKDPPLLKGATTEMGYGLRPTWDPTIPLRRA